MVKCKHFECSSVYFPKFRSERTRSCLMVYISDVFWGRRSPVLIRGVDFESVSKLRRRSLSVISTRSIVAKETAVENRHRWTPMKELVSYSLPRWLCTRVYPQIYAYVSDFAARESADVSKFATVGKLLVWFVAISRGSEWETLFLFVGNLVHTQSHMLLNQCLHNIYTSLSI